MVNFVACLTKLSDTVNGLKIRKITGINSHLPENERSKL